MSETCRSCPLIADNGMLFDALKVCATPSEVCNDRRQNIEDKMRAWNRLRSMAELCASEVLDLMSLLPGDIIRLYGSRKNLSYRQAGWREVALRIDGVGETGALHTTVLEDKYGKLFPTDVIEHRELPIGAKVRLPGYWNPDEKQVVEGILVVGAYAVCTTDDLQQGILLQEIAVTDSAGVGQMMWGTSPLRYREAPDFLQDNWAMPS